MALGRRLIAVAVVVLGVTASQPALAFPPYRSTDADTADPWWVEARLGLVSLSRDAGETDYSTPLVRVNLGFPHKLELLTELEYDPDEERLADAGVGFKWIPLFGHPRSAGFEVLLLVPVTDDGGLGVEALALGTWRTERLRVHANAGGFRDDRGGVSVSGWKAGLLAELPVGRVRPGLELAAKDSDASTVSVQAGGGAIISAGAVDLRIGAHIGVTDGAPDLTASVWVTGKFAVR